MKKLLVWNSDNNPNIPTANYSDETAIKIQETIKKKWELKNLKNDWVELKQDKKKNLLNLFLTFHLKYVRIKPMCKIDNLELMKIKINKELFSINHKLIILILRGFY